MKVYLTISILLISIHSFIWGQNLDLKFENINIKDGLSSNIINDIKRDHYGFIWLATEDGLNRYDGSNFKIYRHTDKNKTSILNNRVNSIYCDSSGVLLVGTHDGLSKYSFAKDHFIPIIENIQIRDIFKRKNGEYLLATNDGVYVLDETLAKTESLIPEKLLSKNLTCIGEDKYESIWFGYYQQGIGSIKSNGKLVNYSKPLHNLDANICEDLIINNNGELVIATYDNGIFTYNQNVDWFLPLDIRARNKFGEEKNPNIHKIRALFEDEEQRLWFGTDGAGLGMYNPATKRIINYIHILGNRRSISDNVINCIYSDGRKGFWVGTFHRGINFVNKYSNNFKHIHYLPSYKNVNVVSCFKKDQLGNLWIGTDGGGLICQDLSSVIKGAIIYDYSKKLKDEGFERTVSSYNILTLETDTLHQLWAGSYFGGIDIIDLFSKRKLHNFSTKNSFLPSNVIWNIQRDQFGRIWVSTMKGLALYDPNINDFKIFSKSNTNWNSENVRCVEVLNKEELLIGTSQGLVKFNLNDKTSKIYLHEKDNNNSIGHDFILKIMKDSKDRIWIGSYGGGISLYKPKDETFQNWTTEDGLCNNFICTILEGNDGNLWLTTSDGLSSFNPETEYFNNFHFRDGIQDDKFSIGAGINWNEEKLLVGGINGYNSFIPSNIQTNSFAPPLHFIDFKIFNESVDFNSEDAVFDKHISLIEEVELNYDQNTIQIEFAALNFIQSEKNNISFYMEGVDKNWSEPQNVSKANYTSLAPGEYIFRVKAANNHGIWNPEELTLKIIIKPPFWQTWWFKILTVIFLIGSTLLIIKNRLKNIIAQKQELEREVASRTEEIKAKNIELQTKEERTLQSINYAKLIQTAILPSDIDFKASLDDYFILYKPHSIVSGDFYWFDKKGPLTIIAAIDCTGHGVPGAFMSMMGSTLMNKIVQTDNITSPSKILEKLHHEVVNALHQDENLNTDGMDMSLVVINHETRKMYYAGAMNPLLYFQNGNATLIRGSRASIGGFDPAFQKVFEEHEIDISTETTFYLYSDGYQDQFGANGKKFMSKRFKNLLGEIHSEPMDKQNNILESTLLKWTENKAEQTDDILIIGVRV